MRSTPTNSSWLRKRLGPRIACGVFVAMAITLAACGSDSEGSAAPDAGETVSSEAAPSEAAPSEAAPSETAPSEAAPSEAAAPDAAAAPSSGKVDCAALRNTDVQEGLGLAAAPGAIFLLGDDATKAKVAELPELIKGLRVLEPFEKRVGSLPPLREALDRFQQRADAAAAALDGQDASREAFNSVESDLRDELTLDIAALSTALSTAGCAG